MKFTQLKQDITQGARPIYLLQGEDAYFLTHAEEMIKDAFLQMPELNFTTFDGESLKGAQLTKLTDALNSYPFMAEKRLVKVTEFYPSESDWNAHILKLTENFPSQSILIIVNAHTKKGSVDLKKKKGITYVDCGKADEEEVARWVYITLKRSGIYADVSVCMSVAQYCLSDMSRVAIETQKLIEYKGGGTLTQDDVENLVYKDADYRIYELTNAIGAGNYSKFCTIADELLGKGADEISLLNSLFNYFRTLITVKSSGKSDDELSKELNIKPYAVKKNREQANRLGMERLCLLADKIYGSLADIKRGALTVNGAYYAVCANIFFGGGKPQLKA